MDWFSWLSKTNLEATLVYQYGLEFTRNELEADDIPHFDHEFLISMGISIAKHRLEILKIVKKEVSKPLFDFKKVIQKTRKSLGKYIGRLMSLDHDDEGGASKVSSMEALAKIKQWKEEDTKGKNEKEMVVKRNRSLALSGPLDKRLVVSQKTKQLSGPLVYTPKSPIASGCLDACVHEKAQPALRSPKLSKSGTLDAWTINRSPRMPLPPGKGSRSSLKHSGSLDGMRMNSLTRSPIPFGDVERDEFDEHSLWTKMFHDMKPT